MLYYNNQGNIFNVLISKEFESMDSHQIYNIIFFIICLIISALFSSSEEAFLGVRETRLKMKIREGDEKAERTLKLTEKYEHIILTILIGNVLINIIATVIATAFFMRTVKSYAALIAGIFSFFIIFLISEIIPKFVAKNIPEEVAIFNTNFIKFFMIVLAPLVWLVQFINSIVKKQFHINNTESISEEELLHYVEEAREGGSIENDEHKLVKAAIEFDDVNVEEILIPRRDIVSIEVNDSDEEIEEVFDEHYYSRLVVYEDTVDKVLGIIHEKDFHRYLRQKRIQKSNIDVRSIISELLYIPGMVSLSDLLHLMQREKKHMAAIIDEHGGLEGIVTMEDILEQLVGEIWDESDEVEQEIKIIERDKLIEVSGKASLEKIFTFLGIEHSDDYNANSIGGFAVEMLDKMPRFGDSFIFENYKFTINKVKSNRIETIKIKYLNK